jgi:hypothetical protein
MSGSSIDEWERGAGGEFLISDYQFLSGCSTQLFPG